jgi:hypothetical protein
MYTPWEGPSVSFDTSIVNQMKDWLEVHGDKWTFTTREGAHSMYIDCVQKTMHKSSYDEASCISLSTKNIPPKPVPEQPNADEDDILIAVQDLPFHIKEYFSTL